MRALVSKLLGGVLGVQMVRKLEYGGFGETGLVSCVLRGLSVLDSRPSPVGSRLSCHDLLQRPSIPLWQWLEKIT